MARLKPRDLVELAAIGSKMSASEAERLEQEISSRAHDAGNRARLVGFYSRHMDVEPRLRGRFTEHAVWFVQNAPASAFVHVSLRLGLDAEGTSRCLKVWEAHLSRSRNPAVIANAAEFFAETDPTRADGLFSSAAQAAPDDPRWLLRHAEFLRRQQLSNPAPAAARRELELRERAHGLTSDLQRRFYQLDNLAENALRAGQPERAALYAEETLRAASTCERDWNYGNAIYAANEILGRIALQQGDVEEAKRRLIAASTSPGSPQLNSFGPGFELASDLAARGHLETVGEFLENVPRFWELGQAPLDKWRADVRAGRAPDFEKKTDYKLAAGPVVASG